jgi:hypothetical protein
MRLRGPQADRQHLPNLRHYHSPCCASVLAGHWTRSLLPAATYYYGCGMYEYPIGK